MKQQLIFAVLCLGLVVTFSCGKVTQETAKTARVPSFQLTGQIDDVFVPSDNVDVSANLRQPYDFYIEDPLYVVVKGYAGNKVDQLSWGKASVEITEKQVQTSSEDPTKPSFKTIKNYESISYDAKGHEIKAAARRTQIKSDFDQERQSWTFTAAKVPIEYDRYFVGVFSSDEQYRFAFVDQSVVSDNKIVQLDEVSLYDSFRAMTFLAIYEHLDYDDDLFDIADSLFDISFYQTLGFDFPNNQTSKFNMKKPVFYFDTLLFDELMVVVDLAWVDLEECKTYISLNPNNVWTDIQKKKLLENIQILERSQE